MNTPFTNYFSFLFWNNNFNIIFLTHKPKIISNIKFLKIKFSNILQTIKYFKFLFFLFYNLPGALFIEKNAYMPGLTTCFATKDFFMIDNVEDETKFKWDILGSFTESGVSDYYV